MDYFKSAWNFANNIFSPKHSYLSEKDDLIEWMYRARSIIGALMLVAIGLRYHHAVKDVIQPLAPVLGGVTKAMLTALVAVVPSAIVVVALTHKEKRRDAWQQMRYPLRALLAWIALYLLGVGYERGMHRLLAGGISFWASILIWVLICALGLWILTFVSRAVYLITTGLCRLGDGHPLLPPVIGPVIVWVLAVIGLTSGNGNGGEPAAIALLVLWCGPVSVTALSVAEILRLQKKYPKEFPFLDGPLKPPRDRLSVRHEG